MFTLSLIYVLSYLFLILSLLILIFTQLPIHMLTSFSLPNFIIFIQKYKVEKNLYLWLFFSLTGLPPVGLFFVKFNLFFFILYQTHILIIFLLFLFFLFNMLFYVQLFNFRNYKKSLYSVVNGNIFNNWSAGWDLNSNYTTYTTYKVILSIINVIFFLSFTVFFFGDYFLILNII